MHVYDLPHISINIKKMHPLVPERNYKKTRNKTSYTIA
jgi:hypothetical protein